jgi:plastocyanin
MRTASALVIVLALAAGLWTLGTTIVFAQDFSNDDKISLLDSCDPPSFTAQGIVCAGGPHAGDVTFGTFLSLLFSPLVPTVVGHPAWRFSPSYLDVKPGHTLRVNNNGGEQHTFTEVTAFGGGIVPPLNGVGGPAGTQPLVPAAACGSPNVINPGAATEITGLAPGMHKFQCCIHPWMRAVVVVQ